MEWHDRDEVKKGDFGESIVRRWMESQGWVLYRPETEGPHAFDRVCVKGKKEIMIAEVKTKARMTQYNATGFNTRHFREYCTISDRHNLDVFIFFVDEHIRSVYGNYLSALRQEHKVDGIIYPKTLRRGEIIIFSLEKMITITKIEEEEAAFLKSASHRNYEYPTAQAAEEWAW